MARPMAMLLLLLASWPCTVVATALDFTRNCSFPHSLAGLQCKNMQSDPSLTAAACEAACCKAGSCSTWNFSPGHQTSSCWLWLGAPSPGPYCVKPDGTWKTWLGGSNTQRPVPPPGPAPSPPAPSPPLPPGAPIVLDLLASGPVLGGIGAISGGGATSRLLVDYPEPQRSELLDMMFKPLAGAALQVLKVEIGGTGFTSDGSEASHMYTEDDDSPVRFERGYEFWLMKEAKKRNPSMVFYGLPWAWPSWVGGSGSSPWTNLSLPVRYIVDWVRGAKEEHGIDVGWIGDWNETPTSWDYNLALRAALDAAGFTSTRIAASDQGNGWAIPTNATQLAVIDAIAAHYPGVHGGPPPTQEKALLNSLSKPMFAAEDGAGTPYISSTWTRTVNQNYVVLNISATIAWNLITAYDDDLPYTGRGIMGVANTPWCGSFEPYAAVWATAHTTWFTEPQIWRYIGGGHLAKGGSFVALTDGKGALTVVIEKQAWNSTNQGQWRSRYFPMDYRTEEEELHFDLRSTSVSGARSAGRALLVPSIKLGVWRSHFAGVSESQDPGAYANASTNTRFLVREADITTAGSSGFTVAVGVNEIVTISTKMDRVPSVAPALPRSPPPCTFPRTYADDFDSVAPGQEAKYFQDMHGAFEAVNSSDPSRGMVMRQMAVGQPIGFHSTDGPPLSVLGSQVSSSDGSVSVDFLIERSEVNAEPSAAVLGSHITNAQCSHCGVYLTIGEGRWAVGPSIGVASTGSWKNGTCQVRLGGWHSMKLNVTDGLAYGWLDGKLLFSVAPGKEGTDLSSRGWVGIGTGSFSGVQFDKFVMEQ